jgi:Na+-driven multidrug efflux pump
MFVLGVSLKGKENQEAVYPRIGPIFGYFEIASLAALLITGTLMIMNNGLITILWDDSIHNMAIDALREKLLIVAAMTFITVLHTVIAFRTNGKERTKWETIVSRGSSMGIFILNFIVLHHAIVIRDVL